MKIKELKPQDNEFTKQLINIPSPPKRLFYRGELPNSKLKSVAIVGTRKPTSYGKEIAFRLASALAQHGVVVISGMALGIDGIAHRGALEAKGTTIAVLANGVDAFYPKSHHSLGEKIIASGGAVVSEYPNKTPPQPYRFLERNRIVSGLSDVVIVVEAAARSGTLSTANHALDQGKDVFAVPGNITSPLSTGCNKLIKMGAQPLTEINDIIDFLIPQTQQSLLVELAGNTPEETIILNIIQSGINDGEEILTKSNLTVSNYNQTMTMLEISDKIRSLGANKWSLK